jgi:hypothetical protein
MPFGLNDFVSGAESLGTKIGGNVGGLISKGAGFLKSKLPKGAEKPGSATTEARMGSVDWRVSLSVPPGSFETSPLFEPIRKAGNKLIFPYTPTITISHSASYSAMDPVHSNYPFFSYENSKVDKINLQADFYLENGIDADYWLAMVHFFRSSTKMYFGGKTEFAGAPPPVLKLNGYGDYVFKNVPVVVTNFQMEMPKDVDYMAGMILTPEDLTEGSKDPSLKLGVSYAPVKSVISLTLQPVYSRETVRNFNMQDFVNGKYVEKGGFI